MLSLRYCPWAFSSCGAWASHCGGLSCWVQALGSRASVVVEHGLCCSAACGIFPDQGSNPCPLNWQVNFFFNWSCKTSENWSNTYAYPYLGESLVKDNSFLRETRMASKFLTTGPPGKSHFIPFYWQIRFLCINVPYFVYPFISWCTFGLLLLFWLL